MKKFPKITVYIVNRNYGKYIRQALESVISQTYKNIELIIIDDNSTDNSKVLIKTFKKKYIKTIILFNKKKIGLVKSINRAIKKSKGKYIIRLDSDDYLHPKAVKEMYLKIKNDKKIGLVFPNFYWINSSGQILSNFKYNYKSNYLIKYIPAHGACSLINKKILKKIGGYNELFDKQDGYYIWFAILLNNFKIFHIKKNLFFYRKHNRNLSNNINKILKTRLKILNYLINNFLNFSLVLSKHKKNTLKKLKLNRL
jgi:glycosyltransferase involved in cell wall biosynthesis